MAGQLHHVRARAAGWLRLSFSRRPHETARSSRISLFQHLLSAPDVRLVFSGVQRAAVGQISLFTFSDRRVGQKAVLRILRPTAVGRKVSFLLFDRISRSGGRKK